jgi:hypothetical protein
MVHVYYWYHGTSTRSMVPVAPEIPEMLFVRTHNHTMVISIDNISQFSDWKRAHMCTESTLVHTCTYVRTYYTYTRHTCTVKLCHHCTYVHVYQDHLWYHGRVPACTMVPWYHVTYRYVNV